MDFEISEPDYVTSDWILNFRISDYTFEPVGAEPISFDLRKGHMCNYLVDDCLIKGYNDRDDASYAGAIECYANGLEVRDTEVWAGNGPFLNCQGNGTGSHSYHLFKNVDVDYSHFYQKRRNLNGGRLFLVYNYSYSRWEDCTFNTGVAVNGQCLYNLGDNSWAGNTYNDFTNSTISGVILEYPGSPGQPGGKPATTAGGFDSLGAGNSLPEWL
jgi:hypothetical protein